MASSNIRELGMTGDFAYLLGGPIEPPEARQPLIQTEPQSTEAPLPIVEEISLIAAGEPIPPDVRIITNEPDGSRLVASPTTTDDEKSEKLRLAVEAMQHPEPARQPTLPPTDNPIVNLGRFIGQIFPTVASGRGIGRK